MCQFHVRKLTFYRRRQVRHHRPPGRMENQDFSWYWWWHRYGNRKCLFQTTSWSSHRFFCGRPGSPSLNRAVPSQRYGDNIYLCRELLSMQIHQNRSGNCLVPCRLFLRGNRSSRRKDRPGRRVLSETIRVCRNSDWRRDPWSDAYRVFSFRRQGCQNHPLYQTVLQFYSNRKCHIPDRQKGIRKPGRARWCRFRVLSNSPALRWFPLSRRFHLRLYPKNFLGKSDKLLYHATIFFS